MQPAAVASSCAQTDVAGVLPMALRSAKVVLRSSSEPRRRDDQPRRPMLARCRCSFPRSRLPGSGMLFSRAELRQLPDEHWLVVVHGEHDLSTSPSIEDVLAAI